MPKKPRKPASKPRAIVEAPGNLEEFHGTPLPAAECAALCDLEQLILQKPLKPRMQVHSNPFREVLEVPPAVEFAASGGHVTKIDVSWRELETLPASLVDLQGLEALNLSINPIKELPAWIGRFARLKVLGACNAQIQEIPPEIGDLALLEDLRLDATCIARVPAAIGRLASLRFLSLRLN